MHAWQLCAWKVLSALYLINYSWMWQAAGWNNCKAEFGLLRQHDEEFSNRKYRNMPRGLDDKGKRKFQSELVIVKVAQRNVQCGI